MKIRSFSRCWSVLLDDAGRRAAHQLCRGTSMLAASDIFPLIFLPLSSVTWPKESVRTVTARDWTPAPTGGGGFGDWVGNVVERFPSDQADILAKFVKNDCKLSSPLR